MKGITTDFRRDPRGHDRPGPGTPSAPGSPIRTPRRRLPRWAALAAIGTPLLLSGCNLYPTYGASRGATKQGQDTFKLYSGMMTTGIIVGGLVGLLILWTLVRYRRRSDEMPRQFHENIPIEVLYTAIPILIVAVLFVYTVLTENNVDATVPVNATLGSTGKPVVDIRVTAFQWGWRFDYTGLNVGIAGETTAGPNNHGPQMVVPAGQTVQITLVSDDVVHGFYVRDFNFSRYALPGVTNLFDLTVLHPGTYNGQCTQICGLYHSEMLFSVKAVTPPAFSVWASNEVRKGNTLQRSGSSASNNPPIATHPTPANASPSPAPAKGSA
ncbi:MAG: cytochrome c oxidase subunit II [Acidimicrobiales bacterium]|nr:cytochrome c oxidase subunit II [Acidimicrobiales bacterium]